MVSIFKIEIMITIRCWHDEALWESKQGLAERKRGASTPADLSNHSQYKMLFEICKSWT